MSKASVPAELTALREQIDRLDQSLVLLLANRFALTQRVGELKAREQLQSFDAAREQRKLEHIRGLCQEHGVNAELMAGILEEIMREVVRNHDRIRQQKEGGMES